MLRTALVENVMQLEHVGKKAAKEVQQYSDVVSDLTTDKALLLVNRRLAKAEEHNRQMTAQLRAKNEKLDDLAKLNVELQDLLKIKNDRLHSALAAQQTLEQAAKEAREDCKAALKQLETFKLQHQALPEMVEEKSALESKVEEAHTRAEELREEVKKAAVVAQEAGRKQQHLVASNLELKQQAETAQATLRGEKELNAKLRENNRELLEEYKMLEESRNRCVEVIKMYKGQVGDLSERVEDLVTETSSKSVYLARHQARIEQLSSVVATQHHHAHGMLRTPGKAVSQTGSSSSVMPSPSVRNVGGASKPNTAHSRRAGERGKSRGALMAQASVDSSARGAPSEQPRLASLYDDWDEGQGRGIEGDSERSRVVSDKGGLQQPLLQWNTPVKPDVVPLHNRQSSVSYHPGEQEGKPRKPVAGYAHQMAGHLPSRMPSLAAAHQGSRKAMKATPGLAEPVGVAQRQRGQRAVPLGHEEWEQALEAGVREHHAQLVAEQEAAWAAQGKRNNPLLPPPGETEQHRQHQRQATGGPSGTAGHVMQQQRQPIRQHQYQVSPHPPSKQYAEYNPNTGRQHIVQSQLVT